LSRKQNEVDTIKALVLERGKVKNIPKPLPAENEALVKVLKAGICSTDLELAIYFLV